VKQIVRSLLATLTRARKPQSEAIRCAILAAGVDPPQSDLGGSINLSPGPQYIIRNDPPQTKTRYTYRLLMLTTCNVDEYFQNTPRGPPPYIFTGPSSSTDHKFKITNSKHLLQLIKFTFLVFYFHCFGFDHGIALSIIRIFNCTIYL